MNRARLAVAAFDALPSEAVVLDGDGVLLLANEAWREFGRRNGAGAVCGPGADYLGVCARSAADGDPVAGLVGAALRAVLDGHSAGASLDYPCHSPTRRRWFHLRVRPLPGQHRVLVLHDDISGRVEETARLRSGAARDLSTGLADGVLLQHRLAAALAGTDRRRCDDVAVLLVRVDDVERVCEAYGQETADALLRAVAGRLAAYGRSSDTLARRGADTFVLLLPGCTRGAAEQVRDQVADALRAPVRLGPGVVGAEPGAQAPAEVTVGASFGIAVGRPGADAGRLLAEAGAALHAVRTWRGTGR